jgi:membrane-associated HD superfamily phosphohydrolase
MEVISRISNISRLKTITMVLIAAVFFPFFIHMIPPQNGIPIGAFLLPMFYIPFVALFAYDWKVALPVALLAPVLNFLITGNPNWEFLTVLTLELVLFTGIACFLLKGSLSKWVAAPLGYLGAKIISSILLNFIPMVSSIPWDFFLNSISRALPGIGVLLLINFLLLVFLNKGKQSEYSL